MVSNFLHFASISKGTNTILAKFISASTPHNMETLAIQCLENAPNHHRTFSHTIRNKIYSFLMVHPFIYFTIIDEEFGTNQAFEFLERIKDSFLNMLKSHSVTDFGNLKPLFFHDEFRPVFCRLMVSSSVSTELRRALETESHPEEGLELQPPKEEEEEDEEKDVNGGNVVVGKSSTPKFSLVGKKKNGSSTMATNRGIVSNGDLQKNAAYMGTNGRYHAQKMWKRHVRTVLLIDLVVCCILCGVWLLICRGLQCFAT